jgi:hypothetical protein
MNVRELKEFVASIPEMYDEDEVWLVHPEYQIQWGPISRLSYPCITDQMQRVLLVDSPQPDWVDEEIVEEME